MTRRVGQRGRYLPRGTPYVPGRRAFGASQPEDFSDIAAGADDCAPHSSVPPAVDDLVPMPHRWHPRQSIAVPIALTLAALAIMQQFPANRIQVAGTVQAIPASIVQPAASTSVVEVAALAAVPADALQPNTHATLSESRRLAIPPDAFAVAATDVAVQEIEHVGAVPPVRSCSAVEEAAGPAGRTVAPEFFGRELASAAEAQTREFVVYDDEYRVIQYPGGDVRTLYGVCTDVVIRAYRALGIDLQRLVHESHVGSGDKNISHRRTEALRRFFRKVGASVAISDFPEDYLAGDIVTYHRPQNSGSNDHIAIVSNVIGPSGHPMIVHNRGFGPQVEDALFVNEMTGHYRYRGAEGATIPLARVDAGNSKPTVHVAQRSHRRIRNSTVRQVRRAAALKQSVSSGQPKL